MAVAQRRRGPDYIINALLALGIAVLFYLGYNFFPEDVALGFILLVGAWWTDAFLKRVLNYQNITVFSDLSFAALIFCGSRGISLATNQNGQPASSTNNLIPRIVIFTAILGFLWLANLTACQGLIDDDDVGQRNLSDNKKRGIWVISFIFAFTSVVIALYATSL